MKSPLPAVTRARSGTHAIRHRRVAASDESKDPPRITRISRMVERDSVQRILNSVPIRVVRGPLFLADALLALTPAPVRTGPHGLPLSGRVRVGHGDGRAPGRGQQRQQRLLAAGAHAGDALPRAVGRRLRLTSTATRDDIAPAARARLRRLPLLGRVGAHRARGGPASRSPRSITTGACWRAATSTASGRASPSTTSPRRAGSPPTAAGRIAPTSTASCASASAPCATSAT